MKILLATRSAHKIQEIRRILSGVHGLELVDLDSEGIGYHPSEEEIEIFETFEENAQAKARYFSRKSALPVIADDSGLEVDALGGAPGVRSKRFAPDDDGEEGPDDRDRANNAHLLRLLGERDSGPAARTARYVCVAALHTPDDRVHLFRGESPGRILDSPQGSGGFGYDPLFFDEDLGLTFAQVSPEEKNARSHRGRAFQAVANHLSYEARSSGK